MRYLFQVQLEFGTDLSSPTTIHVIAICKKCNDMIDSGPSVESLAKSIDLHVLSHVL